MKLPSAVLELLHADRRTDRHAKLAYVILQAFLAKAPENEKPVKL
jgi:hypothetical protein